jgi:hypothetical protein
MKLKIATAALAALALATVAQAVPINGTINITASGTTANIDSTANTVTFNPAAPSANAAVDASTGNIALLLPATTALVYKNFTYAPLSVVNPIWSGVSGGFTTSFNLTSISFVDESFDGANFVGLILRGTGVMSSTRPGYDPTPGAWSFNASNTGSTFSWGSTGRVPDGGATLALLGASVLGLGGTRRFLASSKK